MTLRNGLLLLLALVLTAGMVPAGILVERRLGQALVDRSVAELGAAPMILKARLQSERDLRMMHARDYAAMPDLAGALAQDDMENASRMMMDATREVAEQPILVREDGGTVLGPGPVPAALLDATRRGEMPVGVLPFEDGLHLVALAPVMGGGGWMGAVGGSTPYAEGEAAELAGLTRSQVVVLDGDGNVRATTAGPELTAAVAGARDLPVDTVREVSAPDGSRVLLAQATLDNGRVVFARDLAEELAVLPALQRTALVSGAVALVFSLLVGVLFAERLARPVSELAEAADDFAAGRRDIALRPSALIEVRRLSEAFDAMREALAARLTELEEANRELEDRQERLGRLQAQVAQRERLATTGRMLAQLAHEIRNPVASVRNCLEVVRRKGNLTGEARDFADMAVAELLRMHELAEGMLDLHRPTPDADGTCDASAVARETAQLLMAGSEDGPDDIRVAAPEGLAVRMPKEALKQVLLNLLLNAREATDPGTRVEVTGRRDDARTWVRLEVLDRGPGITPDVADRIFDPFFTTKDSAQGVGLGLYTAESLVRAAGGSVEASNRTDGAGARFTLVLPAVS